MSDPKMIPPEVVEAAARAACRTAHSNVPDYDWEQAMREETDVHFWCEQARAVIAAAFNAWPGVRKSQHVLFDGRTETAIILPLPQEASDAE